LKRIQASFVPNEADELHCFQACWIMATEHLSREKVTMPEAEKVTSFIEGRPTWQYSGIMGWVKRGFYVRVIESLDTSSFVKDPVESLKQYVGDDATVEAIVEVSDFELEARMAKECLESHSVLFDRKTPDLQDISSYCNGSDVVMANVNYWTLLGEDKYAGHYVIIEDVLDNEVLLQNPGPPPIEDQIVTKEKFISAWHYPNSNLANCLVVSKNKEVVS
jgi:hypothetical protein